MRGSSAINPAAYSGGTFIVHPPNYSAYYMRAMMHQQAKQQALSQYYDKLQNNINPAGVRSQDLDGWNQKADAWQQFGIEHRDALINPRLDGGRSMAKFQAMHRDLLGDVAKSKQAAQHELALQKVYSNPNTAARATKQDLNVAHSISASIYDPQHYKEDGVTPHDISEFSFNAPPYDINKQKSVAGMLTRGLKPTKTYGKASGVDPQTRLTVVPFTEKHSTSNLQTIAERMGQVYDSDKSVQGHYDNDVIDPNRFDQLNKAYKSVYPNDDIGNDPRKHAMADAILDNSQSRQSSELRSVSRPPVGRGLTKAQQDQQLMLGLTNQMAAAMKSGNTDEVKRLGGVWFSGNGKSQYQDIDQGQLPSSMGVDFKTKGGYLLHHIEKQWVPDDPRNPAVGSYKDVLKTDEIDPNDPQLISKLANWHQRFMGSTPALEKGVVGQTLSQPSAGKPAPVDPDALIDHYSKP